MLGSVGMKLFYFFFWKAIKIAGSAQKNGVGRVSGNAGRPIYFFRPKYHFHKSQLICPSFESELRKTTQDFQARCQPRQL